MQELACLPVVIALCNGLHYNKGMSNLLDKLNVLVRSSLTSLGGSKIPAARLGKDIDSEIAALRKKIDEALATEDTMQQRLDSILKQAAGYDQQADDALKRGDESNARYAVQEMHRLEQQANMVQADLENHRRSTSDFIERVNMLEAMVSDARRDQQQKQSQAPQDQPTSQQDQVPAQQTSDEDRSPGVVLSTLLRDARERVENAIAQKPGESVHNIKITIDNPSANSSQKTDQKPDQKADTAKETKQVDDDLAQRRSRLSKPE